MALFWEYLRMYRRNLVWALWKVFKASLWRLIGDKRGRKWISAVSFVYLTVVVS